MIYQNEDQLKKGCASIIAYEGEDVLILDQAGFQEKLIDDLIYSVVFSPDPAAREPASGGERGQVFFPLLDSLADIKLPHHQALASARPWQ